MQHLFFGGFFCLVLIKAAVSATHGACLDFQVPFDPTWQQEQLSLGAPPSLHTQKNNQRGNVTEINTLMEHTAVTEGWTAPTE